jgi:hypothetical protein
MPNHCENDLRVSGPDADVQRMLDTCWKIGEGEEEGQTYPDFRKIIPYPERFLALDAIAETWDKALEKVGGRDSYAEFVKAHGPRPKDGFNQGGHEWRCEHWGTKWSAYSPQGFSRSPVVTVSFSTAWGPPTKIITRLAEMFPTLEIEMASYERGMEFGEVLSFLSAEEAEEIETPRMRVTRFDYHGVRGG